MSRIRFLSLPILWVCALVAGCDEEPTGCDRGVYEGDVEILTPADLEALAGYSEISGSLMIRECESCTDLSDLVCLERIDGLLRIEATQGLSNLDGLDGLVFVGSRLNIGYNESLTDIDALSNLASIGSSLFIGANPVLEVYKGGRLVG